MRKTTAFLVAAGLIGSTSFALAATDTSAITDINQARDTITLKDGSTFEAPKKADLSRLNVGERVAVTYVMHAGARDATHISQAPGNDADLGG